MAGKNRNKTTEKGNKTRKTKAVKTVDPYENIPEPDRSHIKKLLEMATPQLLYARSQKDKAKLGKADAYAGIPLEHRERIRSVHESLTPQQLWEVAKGGFAEEAARKDEDERLKAAVEQEAAESV